MTKATKHIHMGDKHYHHKPQEYIPKTVMTRLNRTLRRLGLITITPEERLLKQIFGDFAGLGK